MNYSNSFTTTAPHEQVFNALTTQIPAWWTEDFKGSADRVGEEFTVRFGKTFKRFKVTELNTDSISWTCLDSWIDIETLQKKDEWIGTRIIWTITKAENGSSITMLHEGLTRVIECFEVCQQGWISFLASLQNLLQEAKGQPFTLAG